MAVTYIPAGDYTAEELAAAVADALGVPVIWTGDSFIIYEKEEAEHKS